MSFKSLGRQEAWPDGVTGQTLSSIARNAGTTPTLDRKTFYYWRQSFPLNVIANRHGGSVPCVVFNVDEPAWLYDLIIHVAITLRSLHTVAFTVPVRSIRTGTSINWNIFYITAPVSL